MGYDCIYPEPFTAPQPPQEPQRLNKACWSCRETNRQCDRDYPCYSCTILRIDCTPDRAGSACGMCRKRKRRCDRLEPCSQCQLLRQTCIYQDSEEWVKSQRGVKFGQDIEPTTELHKSTNVIGDWSDQFAQPKAQSSSVNLDEQASHVDLPLVNREEADLSSPFASTTPSWPREPSNQLADGVAARYDTPMPQFEDPISAFTTLNDSPDGTLLLDGPNTYENGSYDSIL